MTEQLAKYPISLQLAAQAVFGDVRGTKTLAAPAHERCLVQLERPLAQAQDRQLDD